MADKSEDEESLESRIEQLEDQIGEDSFEDIKTHIAQIENKQEELQRDLEGVVGSFRRQGRDIPHIDSVKAVRNRLEDLEENLSNLRELIDEAVTEENDT